MADTKQIRLDGPCTVATIAVSRDAVLQAFETGGAIALDLGGVTDADVTLPQLALAARKTADLRELPFRITAWSEQGRRRRGFGHDPLPFQGLTADT